MSAIVEIDCNISYERRRSSVEQVLSHYHNFFSLDLILKYLAALLQTERNAATPPVDSVRAFLEGSYAFTHRPDACILPLFGRHRSLPLALLLC